MPGVALDAPIQRFSGNRLVPARPERCFKKVFNVAPSQTFAAGTLLSAVGASANDVQTFSITGSPTGGSFYLLISLNGQTYQTGQIAYNATATGTETGNGTTGTPYVTVTGALAAAVVQGSVLNTSIYPSQAQLSTIGSANILVSGGALPGTATVVTFQGRYAGIPVPVMTAGLAALTGGTPVFSIAHTTIGATAGEVQPYTVGQTANPTAAPTASVNTGTATPPAAGDYEIVYTYSTAAGESGPSPAVNKVADGTHDIIVASIAFPAGVTAVNYYVNGFYDGQNTVAGTFVVNEANLTNKPVPADNTTANPVGFSEFDVASDTSGNITFGLQSGGDPLTGPESNCAVFINGDFNSADLIGVDANALRLMRGRLVAGTLTSGLVRIP